MVIIIKILGFGPAIKRPPGFILPGNPRTDTIYFTDTKEETPDGRERRLNVNGGDAFILKAEKAETLLTVVRAKMGGNPE